MKTKDFVQIDDNWWASVLADEKGQASKPEEILPIGQKKRQLSHQLGKSTETLQIGCPYLSPGDRA